MEKEKPPTIVVSTIETDVSNNLDPKFMYMRASLPSLASTIEEEAAVEDRTWTKIVTKLKEFSLETTGHGLPRIVEAQSYYMKFIWLACYLASIALCITMVSRLYVF